MFCSGDNRCRGGVIFPWAQREDRRNLFMMVRENFKWERPIRRKVPKCEQVSDQSIVAKKEL